jgi:hypothetical protein
VCAKLLLIQGHLFNVITVLSVSVTVSEYGPVVIGISIFSSNILQNFEDWISSNGPQIIKTVILAPLKHNHRTS